MNEINKFGHWSSQIKMYESHHLAVMRIAGMDEPKANLPTNVMGRCGFFLFSLVSLRFKREVQRAARRAAGSFVRGIGSRLHQCNVE